jgi:DNA-binding Lrp family transcriptional regulator
MGGIGVTVGRNAMRLISTVASVDTEGAQKLNVAGLILRAITGSSDPYIRWYASMGLRKLDPSIIQKESSEIVSYSMEALVKDNDEKIRVAGALTLTLVASIVPEALEENDAIKTIIKLMQKDPNAEVQELAAMTLQFVARKDVALLRGTKIGEALCETMIDKLESLKKGGNRTDREVLVAVASTISILVMRDLSTLTESKGIEEINITQVITNALAESADENEVRPILLSILLELSDKVDQYINDKKLVNVLANILESVGEGVAYNRSVVSILNKVASRYPNLLGEPVVLEKVVSASLRTEKAGTEGLQKHGLMPMEILDTLVGSEKGYKAVVAGFQKIYKDKPYLISDLCELRNWNNLMNQVKGEASTEKRIEKPTEVAAIASGETPSAAAKAETKREMAVATPEEEKGKPAPSTRLGDEQKALLQEVFRTYTEIPLADLARKLNVREEIVREVLNKLVHSGKLPYSIQNDVLYLKGAPKVESKARKRSTLCVWCGSELAPSDEKCPSCGKSPPKCLICNGELTTDDELEKCPFCGTLFHKEHYKKWAKTKKNCPKCGVTWA